MTRVICPNCKVDLDRGDWICPHCETPAEEVARRPGQQEISNRGMLVLLLLCVGLPVLLFLLHIFVPGL